MYEICRVCGETAGAYVHDQSATAADVHPFEMAAVNTDRWARPCSDATHERTYVGRFAYCVRCPVPT